MKIKDHCFTYFTSSIEKYNLPERFTFPFYYQPHPLCVLAAQQLQQHLKTQTQWQHNFGLADDPHNIIGKMFGVLLVKNTQGELGFLSAFSGKLAEQSLIQGFVPPVFDLLAQDSFFLSEKVAINKLNEEIKTLENTLELITLKGDLSALETEHAQQLSTLRIELVENRKIRKIQRQALQNELDKSITDTGLKLDSAVKPREITAPTDAPDYGEKVLITNKVTTSFSPTPITPLVTTLSTSSTTESRLKELAQQSVFDKWRLKELGEHSQQSIKQLQLKVNKFTDQITELQLQRKNLSGDLQNRIFSQYQFLNQSKESKSLLGIFADTALKIPPAGAGECAAPKLLQYAFKHQLTPLAMAEFWWGASPKSEVKKHQQYYPACTGKCQPILKHMLSGMQLDDNPLIYNYGEDKNIGIIYQDEDILIVNKPTEFLSVPGKEISDSVYQRIKLQFPEATGPLIVHRLDMSTSGLMVLALNPLANKYLQKQFIHREVHKQYVALIEGLPQEDEGEIKLPIRGDFYDRPKQMVCHQDGKQAHTFWQVLERYPKKNQTRVLLTPHTGRTHQLRVHCAHAEGLNMPIVGDDLYGVRGKRLHLHAQSLKITHPVSKEAMTFKVDTEF